MNFEKMVKIAKALNRVFKILQRVIIICAAVVVFILGVFTVINYINPDYVIGTEFKSVDIGPLTFTLTDAATLNSNTILTYAWIIAAAAVVYIVILLFVLSVFRRILKPMAEGEPFAPFISREIRRLAFFSLAIGVISNVFSAIGTFAAVHLFNLSGLLQNSQVQSIRANFNFDVTFVITFFVLLLASYIFQYGEELQKLSDETL